MTQGQIEALEHHASDEIKAVYLPKLISGKWCGTMNLTEPKLVLTLAHCDQPPKRMAMAPMPSLGKNLYLMGDNDFSENVCHLVLARLPDGVPGTKGISLFLVPKRLPDENGDAGIANSLKVVSLEHKMGSHGSRPLSCNMMGPRGGWSVSRMMGCVPCLP